MDTPPPPSPPPWSQQHYMMESQDKGPQGPAPLRFVPFNTNISPAFWVTLSRKKLQELKLDNSVLPIWGWHSAGTDARPSPFQITEECFEPQVRLQSKLGVRITGELKLYNTMEEFRAVDKVSILADINAKICEAIEKADMDALLSATSFKMIAFADLKRHKYHYHLLYPGAFDSQCRFEYQGDTLNQNVSKILVNFAEGNIGLPWFFFNEITEECQVAYDPGYSAVIVDSVFNVDDTLGWSARNLLLWLSKSQKTCILYRVGGETHVNYQVIRSIVRVNKLKVTLVPFNLSNVQITGWGRDEKGIVAPASVDLSPMMDPKSLAKEATDLNLKLIKWRLLPSLSLEIFANAKVLLFGAGTLGCNVTRVLLGWGFKNITLVDNGRVSYSNPPRQSLFHFEDCSRGGKLKAETAAARALEIDPSANVKGVCLHIPMPGHRIQDYKATSGSVKEVHQLIKDNDLIFLLTDSRESRWLPTVFGAATGKMVVTIALGFDSFVAMRHGTTLSKLGCYFCSDINAPSDTMSGRTLDQQCTVTRPGISYLASAVGVELAASLLQHPMGVDAPSLFVESPTDALPVGASILGVVPHQVRGFLSHFQNMLLTGEASNHCTACSQSILDKVNTNGVEFIMQALERPEYVAELSGARTLQEKFENLAITVEPVDEPIINDSSNPAEDFCLL